MRAMAGCMAAVVGTASLGPAFDDDGQFVPIGDFDLWVIFGAPLLIGLIIMVFVLKAVRSGAGQRSDGQRSTPVRARALKGEKDPVKQLQIQAALAQREGRPEAASLNAFAGDVVRVRHTAMYGERADATVISVARTGRAVDFSLPELAVTVRLPNGGTGTILCLAPDWLEARIQPGHMIPIRYEPHEPSAMAVDAGALASAGGVATRACAYCFSPFPATELACPNCGASIGT